MTEPLARAKAINEKYQAEVARQIHAINKAIVLIGVLALIGISFSVADEKFKKADLINQEVSNAYRR